ncbi:MAG TPA: thiamine pyrophosphate-dependent enzyme, partial [Chloroflexota bacterium]|nr:thiamine pyrophosphate-dependent enzyme [Chloroflexota bacterium]
AAHLLARAERPVLYAGHGGMLAGAAAELRALSRRLKVPVATTVHGIGLMPDDDPLNLGMLGMHGQMAANIAPHLADLVIALGARFDDRVVGSKPEQFAPTAKVIHVDVDSHQLNRVRQVDLAIHSDVKYAVERLMDLSNEMDQVDREPWISRLREIRAAMPIQSYDTTGDDHLSHEFVYAATAAALSERGTQDVVATFDVGTHQMKGAQWFPISEPRSFLTSGGMGSMGCSLPMAVGAAMARPDAAVIAVAGDGGFVMSSHELDTVGSYRIPVKMIVFDDSALGMVTNWHGLFFDGRDLTSDRRRGRPVYGVDLAAFKAALHRQIEAAESTDQLVSAVCGATMELAEAEWPLFAATAASYAIPAERVRTKAEAAAAIRRALAHDGPYFVHVMLPSKNQVYPLMEPGTTPRDMVWRELIPGSGIKVYARDRFDYETGRLIAEGHANGTNEHANRTESGHTLERDPNGF